MNKEKYQKPKTNIVKFDILYTQMFDNIVEKIISSTNTEQIDSELQASLFKFINSSIEGEESSITSNNIKIIDSIYKKAQILINHFKDENNININDIIDNNCMENESIYFVGKATFFLSDIYDKTTGAWLYAVFRLENLIPILVFRSDKSNIVISDLTKIGKSRFIDEFIKMISKQSYFIKSFDLKPQNQETMTEIYNFLEIEIQNSSTFCSNLQSYNNKYRQRIIVIDNFHNAKDDFLEEVKKYYYNQNNLIKLIIVGRTDYTVGSLKYYEFVNWSKNELNNNDKNNNSTEFSKAVVLKKLSNDDCEKLINSIIKDIPLEALDILKKNANGNPLYVTQFIEYLLDKKLIYIANRNSVGIIDTNHFYSKEGIPKTVYEIYECRFKTLNKLFDKNLYSIINIA